MLWVEVGYGADGAGIVDKLALQLGLDLVDQPDPDEKGGPGASGLAQRGRLLVVLDDLWDVELGRWLAAPGVAETSGHCWSPAGTWA